MSNREAKGGETIMCVMLLKDKSTFDMQLNVIKIGQIEQQN